VACRRAGRRSRHCQKLPSRCWRCLPRLPPIFARAAVVTPGHKSVFACMMVPFCRVFFAIDCKNLPRGSHRHHGESTMAPPHPLWTLGVPRQRRALHASYGACPRSNPACPLLDEASRPVLSPPKDLAKRHRKRGWSEMVPRQFTVIGQLAFHDPASGGAAFGRNAQEHTRELVHHSLSHPRRGCRCRNRRRAPTW